MWNMHFILFEIFMNFFFSALSCALYFLKQQLGSQVKTLYCGRKEGLSSGTTLSKVLEMTATLYHDKEVPSFFMFLHKGDPFYY